MSDLHELHDLGHVERLLRREEVWAGYALGDLDPPYAERTRWFEVSGGALVMTYTLGHTTVMTFGEGRALAGVLARLDLPPSIHCHYPLTHRPWVEPQLTGHPPGGTYLRLGLRAASFVPAPRPDGVELRLLGAGDVAAAQALYDAHYPGNWFEPARVEEGCYLGGFQDGALVAVGGTHVLAPRAGVAALGDIVVDPGQRGRGLGTALTGALCQRLLARVPLLVLNVAEGNAPARRSYAKLGFGHPVPHVEAFGVGLVRGG